MPEAVEDAFSLEILDEDVDVCCLLALGGEETLLLRLQFESEVNVSVTEIINKQSWIWSTKETPLITTLDFRFDFFSFR
jgi:hypothetical protein